MTASGASRRKSRGATSNNSKAERVKDMTTSYIWVRRLVGILLATITSFPADSKDFIFYFVATYLLFRIFISNSIR